MGVLAYLLRVVREYKVWNIGARVTADGDVYTGNYTLIMAIDSMRCFGFRFNRLYEPDDGKVHLLLVRSPGKDNFVNRVRIFFPLFRAFFIGFGKEKHGKDITFRAVKSWTSPFPLPPYSTWTATRRSSETHCPFPSQRRKTRFISAISTHYLFDLQLSPPQPIW